MKRLLRKTKQMTTGVFWGYLSVATKNSILKKFFLLISRFLFLRRGIEIVFNENIGSGLVLGHGRNINVNSRAVIGKNCVLFGGCTIGSVRSGPRKGVPCLGNRVVVGLNAFIGGGVHIGDDVLIAPGAFVNFDVPSHSVVIGNPGWIHAQKIPAATIVLWQKYRQK